MSVFDWIDTVNLLLKIGILKITVRVDRIRFRGGVLGTMGWKTRKKKEKKRKESGVFDL